MTNSLSTRELAHVFTTDAPDEAPVVDGNGDPRFLTERDFPIDDDEFASMSHIERDEIIDELDREYALWMHDEERRYHGMF